MANVATKECTDCRSELPLSEFGAHARMRDGLRKYCKRCASLRSIRWRDANADRVLDTRLRKKFGITLKQYRQMLDEQGGVCAICGQPPSFVTGRPPTRAQGRQQVPNLVVDHDHATGKIRGLLCTPCNRGIGFLKDDPSVVRFALKYLEERG